MRVFSSIIFPIILLMTGCAFFQPETGRNPEDIPINKGPQKEPVSIDTAEIIRILEEEDIEYISTTHSQAIHIQLKDGQEFEGIYVHSQSGKYANKEDLFDILNLVMHIKDKRPPEEVKDWIIKCE